MSEEGEESHHSHHHHHPHLHHHHHHHHHQEDEEQPPPPPQYGTFEGVPSYPPKQVIGFPQPVPPPGASEAAPYGHGYQAVPVPPPGASEPPPYAHGYQAVPGYVVAEGTPVARERRLPCCGIGLGWFCFIIGFLFVGIPWYIAAFIILCAKVDPREKPGYITCTVAAILATIALIFGLTRRH